MHVPQSTAIISSRHHNSNCEELLHLFQLFASIITFDRKFNVSLQMIFFI